MTLVVGGSVFFGLKRAFDSADKNIFRVGKESTTDEEREERKWWRECIYCLVEHCAVSCYIVLLQKAAVMTVMAVYDL